MSILNTVNSRLAVKKQEQEIAKISPLEAIGQAIQNDVLVSKGGLVQKFGVKGMHHGQHKQMLEAAATGAGIKYMGKVTSDGSNNGSVGLVSTGSPEQLHEMHHILHDDLEGRGFSSKKNRVSGETTYTHPSGTKYKLNVDYQSGSANLRNV